MPVSNIVIALVALIGFCLGLLCLAPLEWFQVWLSREPLSPERRDVLRTTYCQICGQHVPWHQTVYRPATGHTCQSHASAPAHLQRVA